MRCVAIVKGLKVRIRIEPVTRFENSRNFAMLCPFPMMFLVAEGCGVQIVRAVSGTEVGPHGTTSFIAASGDAPEATLYGIGTLVEHRILKGCHRPLVCLQDLLIRVGLPAVGQHGVRVEVERLGVPELLAERSGHARPPVLSSHTGLHAVEVGHLVVTFHVFNRGARVIHTVLEPADILALFGGFQTVELESSSKFALGNTIRIDSFAWLLAGRRASCGALGFAFGFRLARSIRVKVLIGTVIPRLRIAVEAIGFARGAWVRSVLVGVSPFVRAGLFWL